MREFWIDPEHHEVYDATKAYPYDDKERVIKVQEVNSAREEAIKMMVEALEKISNHRESIVCLKHYYIESCPEHWDGGWNGIPGCPHEGKITKGPLEAWKKANDV